MSDQISHYSLSSSQKHSTSTVKLNKSKKQKKQCVKCHIQLKNLPQKFHVLQNDYILYPESKIPIEAGLSQVSFHRKIHSIKLLHEYKCIQINFAQVGLQISKQHKAATKKINMQIFTKSKMNSFRRSSSIDELKNQFSTQNYVIEIFDQQSAQKNTNDVQEVGKLKIKQAEQGEIVQNDQKKLQSYLMNENLIKLMGYDVGQFQNEVMRNGIPMINVIHKYQEYLDYINRQSDLDIKWNIDLYGNNFKVQGQEKVEFYKLDNGQQCIVHLFERKTNEILNSVNKHVNQEYIDKINAFQKKMLLWKHSYNKNQINGEEKICKYKIY